MIRKRARLVKRISATIARDHPFLLSLIVVTLVAGLFQYQNTKRSNELEQVVNCTRSYVVAIRTSIQANRDILEPISAATDDFYAAVQAIFTQTADRQDYNTLRQSVNDYLALRAQQRRALAVHPLPGLPERYCENLE